MHEAYDYVTSTAPVAVPDGAVAVGRWSGAGSIGWHDDEVVQLFGWPAGSESAALAAGDGVVRLRATARPVEGPLPWEAGGVFAHRWFEVAPADWDEFLALSVEAWHEFERAYGATIEGLFRADSNVDADADDTTSVLLITRYPSLASWQESRGAVRNPSGDVANAGRNFLRRRELTRRSIVRVAWLVPA